MNEFDDNVDAFAAALMLIALVAGMVFWFTHYVNPKHEVLFAATSCMGQTTMETPDGRDKWARCLKEAHAAHGTQVLEVMGY